MDKCCIQGSRFYAFIVILWQVFITWGKLVSLMCFFSDSNFIPENLWKSSYHRIWWRVSPQKTGSGWVPYSSPTMVLSQILCFQDILKIKNLFILAHRLCRLMRVSRSPCCKCVCQNFISFECDVFMFIWICYHIFTFFIPVPASSGHFF